MDTRRCYVSLHRAERTRGLAMSRRGPVAESPAPAGFGNGARVNIMALVSGDCPSKASPQARNEVSTVGDAGASRQPDERSAVHSSGVAIVFTSSPLDTRSVRAPRVSLVACLRCFCEWNGMERRRGRTGSGARRWSRMICGSGPVASPCGMECSELKARSHARLRQDSLCGSTWQTAQAQHRRHEKRSRSD